MNAAPAHLEAKLRFWEFSIGQLAAVFAGVILGLVWGEVLCPLHGTWGAMSAVYIAALPVIPVFVASQTEFDLWWVVVGAARWRRLEGRYVPGPGGDREPYVIFTERDLAGEQAASSLDLACLWEAC